MNKFIFRICFLIALISTTGYYYISSELKPPDDWDNTILLRKYISAMGAKTVTTLYKDGTISVVSDFNNKSGSYFLNKHQVDKVQAMIVAAGPKLRIFKPKAGVLYDSRFSLETNVKKYLLHTSTDDQLEEILNYINLSKKSVIK
ncbi:MAG: hypothetical protein KC646_10955 [Candidatus Cloacimonetes bacterium]|nr:hypothetical protein [Candidatus Cloacimonadota bacterium]